MQIKANIDNAECHKIQPLHQSEGKEQWNWEMLFGLNKPAQPVDLCNLAFKTPMLLRSSACVQWPTANFGFYLVFATCAGTVRIDNPLILRSTWQLHYQQYIPLASSNDKDKQCRVSRESQTPTEKKSKLVCFHTSVRYEEYKVLGSDRTVPIPNTITEWGTNTSWSWWRLTAMSYW